MILLFIGFPPPHTLFSIIGLPVTRQLPTREGTWGQPQRHVTPAYHILSNCWLLFMQQHEDISTQRKLSTFHSEESAIHIHELTEPQDWLQCHCNWQGWENVTPLWLYRSVWHSLAPSHGWGSLGWGAQYSPDDRANIFLLHDSRSTATSIKSQYNLLQQHIIKNLNEKHNSVNISSMTISWKFIWDHKYSLPWFPSLLHGLQVLLHLVAP